LERQTSTFISKEKKYKKSLKDSTALCQTSLDKLRESRVEVSSLGSGEYLYFVDRKPGFLRTEDSIFPTLLDNDA